MCCRYSEGVTDIQANSIQLVGEPHPVFNEVARPGTVVTTYVIEQTVKYKKKQQHEQAA